MSADGEALHRAVDCVRATLTRVVPTPTHPNSETVEATP